MLTLPLTNLDGRSNENRRLIFETVKFTRIVSRPRLDDVACEFLCVRKRKRRQTFTTVERCIYFETVRRLNEITHSDVVRTVRDDTVWYNAPVNLQHARHVGCAPLEACVR